MGGAAYRTPRNCVFFLPVIGSLYVLPWYVAYPRLTTDEAAIVALVASWGTAKTELEAKAMLRSIRALRLSIVESRCFAQIRQGGMDDENTKTEPLDISRAPQLTQKKLQRFQKGHKMHTAVCPRVSDRFSGDIFDRGWITWRYPCYTLAYCGKSPGEKLSYEIQNKLAREGLLQGTIPRG